MASEFIQQQLNACPDCRGVGRIIQKGVGRAAVNDECPRCDKLKTVLVEAFKAARVEVSDMLIKAGLERAVDLVAKMDRP